MKYLPEFPTTKAKRNCLQGSYIFDCLVLSEIEHCYSMVFSWMMQNLEVMTPPFISYLSFYVYTNYKYLNFLLCRDSLQPSSSLGKMDILIPGTQIPKWFNKQNASSSISMDPTPVMDDPNLIGVACCVLFVAHDDLLIWVIDGILVIVQVLDTVFEINSSGDC